MGQGFVTLAFSAFFRFLGLLVGLLILLGLSQFLTLRVLGGAGLLGLTGAARSRFFLVGLLSAALDHLA